MNPDAPNVIRGIAASPGISIGKAHVFDRGHWVVNRIQVSEGEREKEIARFQKGVEKTKNQLQEIRQQALKDIGQSHAYIFDAHIMILQDDLFIDDTIDQIRKEGINAEWALKTSLDKFVHRFSRVKDDYFKERIQDIEHVIHSVLENLMGRGLDNLHSLSEKAVVVAHDLGPADTLRLDRSKVLAFATDMGGKTAHVAIIASSLFIPAVVGLKTITRNIYSGATIVVDGYEGLVVINPTEEQYRRFLEKQEKLRLYFEGLQKEEAFPAETKDRVAVRLEANIEYSWEIESARKYGAEGVGLFRTEYLYVEKDSLPGEEDLYLEYKRVAEGVKPDAAIIRTIDIGGDKLPLNREKEKEPNPALGLRAIRLCLSNVEMFKTQLRAILRASSHGNLKIMYPMISVLQELIEANRILQQAKEELTRERIPFNPDVPVGIMIETPSAALISDILAKHVDFFSIGTNDLIQYSLAIDRVNEEVAYLYNPLHLAILRLIRFVLQAAERGGIPVGICGTMSNEPIHVLVLLGLGKIGELSMDPQSIPRIKKILRGTSIGECKRIADSILSAESQEEIQDIIGTQVLRLVQDNLPDSSVLSNEFSA